MHLHNIISSILIVLSLFTNYAAKTDKNFNWTSFKDQISDEKYDFEILKAVQTSVHEWNYSKLKHQRAVKRVCYDVLGCFEDSGPFSYLEMLPSHPEEINTKFNFYSTKNRSENPLLQLSFLNMSSEFTTYSKNVQTENPDEKTNSYTKSAYTLNDLQDFDELSIRVIVHGFGSACAHVWIYEMKTALMAVENCIVICVDWSNGAALPNYVKAATNTRLVGKQLAMLLSNLKEHKGLNLTRTHIIGFSLGAHVAGFAGAELPGLSRITGLDPAGPLFESQHPKVRLDNTDAEFVDVIHSNGENLILGGLGSWQPMGHVDFYPNGGRVQKGCSNLFVGAVTDFIWAQTAEVEGRSLCNHRRAYKFFIDSVASRCLFPAFPCDSYESFIEGNCFPCKSSEFEVDNNSSKCGNMGYYANRSTGRGQLYLLTREEEPFCANQFKLEIFNSFNDIPLKTIGKIEVTLEGEGGLNEMFLISEKEDADFFAGDVISKIIVPHPALGFPYNLALQYKSYSGWLSKGLPYWDIDKIVLTDSFGRSFSMCLPLLSLTSGNAERVLLNEGNCVVMEHSTTISSAVQLQTETSVKHQTQHHLPFKSHEIELNKHKVDILNLGVNLSNENLTVSKKNNKISLQSIQGNILKTNIVESGRSLELSSSEILEPVLKKNDPENNRGRNMHEFDDMKVPILKSMSEKTVENVHPKMTATEPITVQLFPFRLSELLQRAERYARETLLPLISEQAPKFFGFDKKENERFPRYIPRYEESFKNVISENSLKQVKKSTFIDLVNKKSLHQLPRTLSQNPTSSNRKSFKPSINYYTNQIDYGNSYKTSVFNLKHKATYINLPTYRPFITTTYQSSEFKTIT